jgi:choline dehydrogenase
VQFWHDGSNKVARASGEVIVSAGAFASPQLLMLSGIGPTDHLEQLGIPVHVDLPVGFNMQSHMGVGEVIFTVGVPVCVFCAIVLGQKSDIHKSYLTN